MNNEFTFLDQFSQENGQQSQFLSENPQAEPIGEEGKAIPRQSIIRKVHVYEPCSQNDAIRQSDSQLSLCL